MSKSVEWYRMTRQEQYDARERLIVWLTGILLEIAAINASAGEQMYFRILRMQMQNEQLAVVIAREEAARCAASSSASS